MQTAQVVNPIAYSKSVARDVAKYLLARPRDSFIVSYPKCGRTWLRFMVSEYFARKVGSDHDRSTLDLDTELLNAAGIPRLLWTHDDSDILSEDGRRPDPTVLFAYGSRLKYRRNKVLLLVRDPRDAVISYYHQVTKRSAAPMSFTGISEFVRHPLYGIDRIIRFYQVWERNLSVPKRLLLVRYEDMMTDGVESLGKILEFISAQRPSDDLLQDVYDYSQADKMRKLEKEARVDGMRQFGQERDALKVRRAKIGSYADELADDDIGYCNERMLTMPSCYGYTVGA